MQCKTAHPLKRPAGSLLLVVLFGLLIVIPFYYTRHTRGADIRALKIESKFLNLGDVWTQSDFRCTLPISNVSGRDVIIDQWKTSCSCLRIQPESVVIRAGETTNLEGIIDLRSGLFTPNGGKFKLTFSALLDEPILGPSRWELTGTTRLPCRVTPTEIAYPPGSLIRGHQFPSRTMHVESLIDNAKISANCKEDMAEVVVSQHATKRGFFDVTVTPRHDLPLGEHVFNVDIKIHSAELDASPVLPIPVVARISDAVLAEPEKLSWGMVRLGETVVERVKLHSYDDADVKVIGVRASDTSIRVEETEKKGIYRISKLIDQLGERNESVTFTLAGDRPGAPTEIEVPIVYYGATADKGK